MTEKKKKSNIAVIFLVMVLALGFLSVGYFIIPSFGGDDSSLDGIFSALAQDDGVCVEVSLVPDSQYGEDLKVNTKALNAAIEQVSNEGGGTVVIPEGTYYFAPSESSHNAAYVVLCKDNVKVQGAGKDKTILCPYGVAGASSGERGYVLGMNENGYADGIYYGSGIDMFNYTETLKGGEKRYLHDADFADFTIDGSYAQGFKGKYNASGKGFFFALFEDCDWENVRVQYTDGTGFGVDHPLNSTMTDCEAICCGKNASSESVGASGFGIGVGYSNAESLTITRCTATDNTKYGFFFEHQSRFGESVWKAIEAKGFTVEDCTATGNYVNFGTARGYDVTFENCVAGSVEEGGSVNTTANFSFDDQSCRIYVVNCSSQGEFSDVSSCSSQQQEDLLWAVDSAVVTESDQPCRFHPWDACTRSSFIVMFWRLCGCGGRGDLKSEVVLGTDVQAETALREKAAEALGEGASSAVGYELQALCWCAANGYIDPGSASASITMGEAAVILYRAAGRPAGDENLSELDNALAWLARTNESYAHIYADQMVTRIDAVSLLRGFDF